MWRQLGKCGAQSQAPCTKSAGKSLTQTVDQAAGHFRFARRGSHAGRLPAWKHPHSNLDWSVLIVKSHMYSQRAIVSIATTR